MADKKRKKSKKSKKKSYSSVNKEALANSLIYKMLMRGAGAGYGGSGSGYNPQAQLNNQYINFKRDLEAKLDDTKSELEKQRRKNEEFAPYAQMYQDLKERNRNTEKALTRKIDMMSGDMTNMSRAGQDLKTRLDMAISKASGKIKGVGGRKKAQPPAEEVLEVENP